MSIKLVRALNFLTCILEMSGSVLVRRPINLTRGCSSFSPGYILQSDLKQATISSSSIISKDVSQLAFYDGAIQKRCRHI